MTREALVQLASMGLCEGCQTPVTMQFMPADAMDATWRCPVETCGVELTGKSFGYDPVEGVENKWKKTRWVGPEGEWVTEPPAEDFKLGSFRVSVGRLSRLFSEPRIWPDME